MKEEQRLLELYTKALQDLVNPLKKIYLGDQKGVKLTYQDLSNAFCTCYKYTFTYVLNDDYNDNVKITETFKIKVGDDSFSEDYILYEKYKGYIRHSSLLIFLEHVEPKALVEIIDFLRDNAKLTA